MKASSRVPFFYGRVAFSRIWLKVPFCYLLFKDSVLLFFGAWLTWRPSLANVCPKLKILFAGEGTRSFGLWISTSFHDDFCPQTEESFPNLLLQKGIILALKGLANHLPFPSSSIFSGRATRMTYIPLPCQLIIGHGVQAAFGLHSDLNLLQIMECK